MARLMEVQDPERSFFACFMGEFGTTWMLFTRICTALAAVMFSTGFIEVIK